MTTSSPRAPAGRSLTLVIVAGSVITSVVIGVRLTFGLYLEPVVGALGTDRGTYALAIAIQNLLWGLSQPVAGAIADRYGSARVLVAGAVGYAASMVLMASAQSTGVLLLSAGFLVGISTGAASFAVVLSAVGRLVPAHRRSLALGVVTAMGSVGQFVLVPLAQRLLAAYGWRPTIMVLAGTLVLVALCAPPFRGRAVDQQRGDEVDTIERSLSSELRRAVAHRPYVLLNLAFFVCGFHVTFIGTHLPSYVADQGIDTSVAASALALIGLFNIIGSFTAGALGGRHPKSRLLTVIYGSRALVIAAYVLVPISAASTLAFGAAFGLLWLSTVPLTSGIVTAQFGTRHSGSLFGIVFLSHQVGAFVGVWLGGELADQTGSYRAVWLIALALGVFAAVVHLFVDETPAPAAPEPTGAGWRLRPGPAAAAVALVGGVGLAAVAGTSAAASHPATGTRGPDGTGQMPITVFCPLHVDT